MENPNNLYFSDDMDVDIELQRAIEASTLEMQRAIEESRREQRERDERTVVISDDDYLPDMDDMDVDIELQRAIEASNRDVKVEVPDRGRVVDDRQRLDVGDFDIRYDPFSSQGTRTTRRYDGNGGYTDSMTGFLPGPFGMTSGVVSHTTQVNPGYNGVRGYGGFDSGTDDVMRDLLQWSASDSGDQRGRTNVINNNMDTDLMKAMLGGDRGVEVPQEQNIEEEIAKAIQASLEQAESDARAQQIAEQDRLYQESLKRDQEKENERLEELKMKEDELFAESLMMSIQENAEEQRKRYLQSLVVPEEPPKDQESVITLKLIFPSGTSHMRRFHYDEPLQTVKNFIDKLELENEIIPPDYVIESVFPRTQHTEFHKTLRELGFSKSERLIIHEM